ncbi:eukaryotic translation initiation factor 3 subunit J [Scenedesmus sp. PABB004]|nr:eukaryotic translation initiation factor 3 subunit J [Scenedesmus sp. PABB004]
MADDWEAEDWERDDFKPALPAKAGGGPEFETAGQAILARVAEPDMARFADEEQQEPEEEASYHIKPQPKKKVEKRYTKGEPAEDDTPLDDPEAERLRRQRLEEESDMRAINDMFGGERAAQVRALEGMVPKTVKDFEEAADLLAKLFVTQHAGHKNYKAYVKALLRAAAEPLPAEDAKEVEAVAAALRADKVKAEKAAAAAKTKTKARVNVGRGGGSAGLDDYIYDDAGAGDDFDFM